MDFMSQLEKIKGIGPKISEALSRRGLRTLKDLFYYFPRNYEDSTQIGRASCRERV